MPISQLAKIEARVDFEYRSKGWERLDVKDVPPGKQGKFDRVYYDSNNGQIHVIEAKGGSGGKTSLGDRIVGIDPMGNEIIAQQGTNEYRDFILNNLIEKLEKEPNGQVLYEKLLDSFEDKFKNIKYIYANQKTNKLSNFTFKEF